MSEVFVLSAFDYRSTKQRHGEQVADVLRALAQLGSGIPNDPDGLRLVVSCLTGLRLKARTVKQVLRALEQLGKREEGMPYSERPEWLDGQCGEIDDTDEETPE